MQARKNKYPHTPSGHTKSGIYRRANPSKVAALQRAYMKMYYLHSICGF